MGDLEEGKTDETKEEEREGFAEGFVEVGRGGFEEGRGRREEGDGRDDALGKDKGAYAEVHLGRG